MDAELFNDLVIGAAGSLIGAATVMVASRGWKITSDMRKKEEQERSLERKMFLEGGISKQYITNKYLFDILKYLFVGSIVGYFGILTPVVSIMSVVPFFLGLGKIIRYQQLLNESQLQDIK